jgi:hypothetical protein
MMITRTPRSVLLPTAVGLLVALAGTPAVAAPGDDDGASTAGLTKAQQRKVAGEIGLGVGLGWAHAGLGLTPELALEGGVRIRLPQGSLGIHLRGGYQTYSVDGGGSLPCSEGEAGPCVSSNDGAYTWNLVEHTGRVSLPLSYRILGPEKRATPYLLFAPGLWMTTSRVTSYELVNSQFSTAFGLYGAAGVQIRLGPGGLFAEAGYQWSQLQHRITGDASLGALRFVIGYRVQL